VEFPVIDLERFLPYRLSVLANVLSSAIAGTYQQRFGLSIPEWRVIAVLSRYPGLSAREVAAKSRMDAVAVSRAVNGLLRAGRLRRAVASDDRRRSVLQVSAAGATVYREVAPLALAYERSLLEALDPRARAALDDSLSRLTRRADEIANRLRRDRTGSDRSSDGAPPGARPTGNGNKKHARNDTGRTPAPDRRHRTPRTGAAREPEPRAARGVRRGVLSRR